MPQVSDELRIREVSTAAGEICRRILDALPKWFGLEEANRDYVAVADRSRCIVAFVGQEAVGILVPRSHGRYSAEIHLMAVLPEYHRQGIGRRMIDHLEDSLRREGVEYLQVKTLSASRPDTGYEKTRNFYLAYGFRPLEEFPLLWSPDNPALQMVKSVKSS